jgi:hypothetical protein
MATRRKRDVRTGGQHPTQRTVTLINTALTALSCSTYTTDAPDFHDLIDRPKCDGNGPIATCSFTEGHGECVTDSLTHHCT